MRRVYIAATGQHAGKTTVSLGLFRAAEKLGHSACFIKPVGQRYVVEDDQQVDEDAVLFKRALGAAGRLKDLSPVTVPRGFTADYIERPDPDAIADRIIEAVNSVEAGQDVTIVEGTGHAGVGSVLDASNARVAEMLGAHVVVVTGGGIGRCIDEVCLNHALFERHGVPVIGAIVNKVFSDKYERVSAAVCKGLEHQGIDCLGAIPYTRELTYPSMRTIMEEFGLEVLCGGAQLDNDVHNIIVAAMEPQNMIHYLTEGSLVVVPGDRVDNILASVNAHLMKDSDAGPQIAGLLLTGGFVPHLSIVNILCAVAVPVLLTEDDTATAAFKVRSLVPKITPRDRDKIALAERIIEQYVDTGRILEAVGLVAGSAGPAPG
jgi:BioD-like phosphotransacetylase family protein